MTLCQCHLNNQHTTQTKISFHIKVIWATALQKGVCSLKRVTLGNMKSFGNPCITPLISQKIHSFSWLLISLSLVLRLVSKEISSVARTGPQRNVGYFSEPTCEWRTITKLSKMIWVWSPVLNGSFEYFLYSFYQTFSYQFYTSLIYQAVLLRMYNECNDVTTHREVKRPQEGSACVIIVFPLQLARCMGKVTSVNVCKFECSPRPEMLRQDPGENTSCCRLGKCFFLC